MRRWIKSWWEGEFEPYENDPRSSIVLIGGRQKRHWTSRAAHSVANFLKIEWKWIFYATVAIAGLLIAFTR